MGVCMGVEREPGEKERWERAGLKKEEEINCVVGDGL